MTQRPTPQRATGAFRPRTVRRVVTSALAAAATLALSACAVTLNPGPGDASVEAGPWQLGEASIPMEDAIAPEAGNDDPAPGAEDDAGPEPGGQNRSGSAEDDESGSPSENESGPGPEDSSDTEPENGSGADGQTTHDGTSAVGDVESGTIQVRPASEASDEPQDDTDAESPASGDDEAPDTGNGGSSDAGSPDDGSSDGGAGGDGGDDGSTEPDTGSEPDLSDPVQYARALEAEVNERREAHGPTALVHDDCAYDVALERAEDLRNRPLAHAPLEPIFERCPTSTAGENLARGGWSPAEAADGWMHSEGHRANILNPDFTRGAIACIRERTSYGPQMTCAHVFLG